MHDGAAQNQHARTRMSGERDKLLGFWIHLAATSSPIIVGGSNGGVRGVSQCTTAHGPAFRSPGGRSPREGAGSTLGLGSALKHRRLISYGLIYRLFLETIYFPTETMPAAVRQ